MHSRIIVASFFSFLLCIFVMVKTKAMEMDKIKIVSKEEAVELALSSHGNIRLLEAKITALKSQKNYIGNELNELENMKITAASKLPINIEFFIEQYPNYEQLTEEEQYTVEQLITTQILINTSLNQLLEAQAEARNHELQEKIKLQREELNRVAKAIDADKNKNQIELEETKEAIAYYISQKYINLLLLESEIEQNKMELSYVQGSIQDFLKLKEHGLINNRDFEKKINEMQKLEQKLSDKEKAYYFYLEELKFDIGVLDNENIQLKPIELEINKLPITELVNKVNKMFSVRKLEEDILLAEKNYNSTDTSKKNLKDYYYQMWQATKYEKDNLVRELDTKIRKLYLDQEVMFANREDLQKSLETLIIDKKDLVIRFGEGLITSVEIEKINQEIQRLEAAINMSKYEYYLLSEKFSLALKGYLI